MPATLGQITAGLKANLSTIDGLRCFDYVPDNFAPPCAVVMLDSVDFNNAFSGGSVLYTVTVTVIVGRASERAAQLALDAYLSWDGDRSIQAAVSADPTLGGVAETLIVQRAENVRMISQSDANTSGAVYLAVDFVVTVNA